MRSRIGAVAAGALLAFGIGITALEAGHPHFVSLEAAVTGDTLQVAFKEAGLGDEPDVHVVCSALGMCMNRGGRHPKATNKESFGAEGTFPVQNGKAEGTLSITAHMQPDCTPPMTLGFTEIMCRDTVNGVWAKLPGLYR